MATSQDKNNKPIVETVNFDKSIIPGTVASAKQYMYSERYYLNPAAVENFKGQVATQGHALTLGGHTVVGGQKTDNSVYWSFNAYIDGTVANKAANAKAIADHGAAVIAVGTKK